MTKIRSGIEALKKVDVFSGLPEEDLKAMAALASEKKLTKGDMLFREGDEARGFYVLTGGKMKVYKMAPDGREQILHFVLPDETFGEVALFSGVTYPAGAEALEPSSLIFLPKQSLFQALEKNPRLALNLLAGFSRWARQFNRLVSEYSKTVPSRVAGYLLAEALRQYPSALVDGTRIRLEINKTEIASFLGTIGPTLSRAFALLRQEGLVDISEREVLIRDLAGLRDYASGEYPS